MKTTLELNLLSPHNSDIIYEKIKFPDGQDHIKIIPPNILPSEEGSVEVHITTRITSASDLFLLLQTTEVLKNSFGLFRIRLTITYLLAARMDRRMSSGEPLTLKIVANLINAMNYISVNIFDPHSEVALTLIDRSEALSNYTFIDTVLNTVVYPLLVVPDAGAVKKSDALVQVFNLERVFATKKRDPKDGKITDVQTDTKWLGGNDCLIVDDICDGGATFTNIAKVLVSKGAGKIYLAVSHGIFSKGIDALENIDHVFTTNSYKEPITHPKLTTIKLW